MTLREEIEAHNTKLERTARRVMLIHQLRKAGWQCAVHDEAVLVRFDGEPWEVVGGSPPSPTLRRRSDLHGVELEWSPS